MKDLYWLITITQRQNAAEYEDFYLGNGVRVNYSMPCSGTAHEKTLALLGIERTEKSVLFSAVPGELLRDLMRRLTVEMKIDLPDRGVAMAVPLASIGGAHTLEYLTGEQIDQEKETEKNEEQTN